LLPDTAPAECLCKLAEAFREVAQHQAAQQLVSAADLSTAFEAEVVQLQPDQTAQTGIPAPYLEAEYASDVYTALDRLFTPPPGARDAGSHFYLTTLPTSLFITFARPKLDNWTLDDSFGADKKTMRIEPTLHLDRYYVGRKDDIEAVRQARAALLEKRKEVEEAKKARTTHHVRLDARRSSTWLI
jgi:hypothetical protein